MQTTELSNSQEKQLLVQSTMISSMLSNQNTQEINKPSLICINGVEAHYVCMNKNCKHQQAIICNDNTCGCREEHKYCFHTSISSIIFTIQQKAFAFKNIESNINKTFEKIIDNLSEMRDNFLSSYQKLFKQKLYFPQQRKFFNEINSNSKSPKITGQMMSKIYGNVYDRNELNKEILESQKIINQISQRFKNNLNEFGRLMEKQLIILHQNIIGQKNQTYFDLNLMKKSQIIKSSKDMKQLQKFFPKKIQKVQLLYKASQQNFSGDNFHKLCDDKQKVLILIRTKHNKVIGGYTPYGFSSTLKDVWIQDNLNQCFIFSLTQKDKIPIFRSKYSTLNFSVGDQFILQFGHDLVISDFANQNQKSKTKLSDQYKHVKYPENQQGYKKFTGSDSKLFGIDEWQVWRIN